MTHAAISTHGTHDPAEIARFDATAQRWWDPHGEFRPLHVLNPVRLAYVDARASLRGKRVLDVGCGGGLLSEAMAKAGRDRHRHRSRHGDDRSRRAACARKRRLGSLSAANPRKHTQLANAGTYDVVTCMEMLEHVPEPQSVMRALRTLVKPGGDVFVSTINRNLKAYLLAIVGAEYVLRLARARHAHLRALHSTRRSCRAGRARPVSTSSTSQDSSTTRFARDRPTEHERRCELHDAFASSRLTRGSS